MNLCRIPSMFTIRLVYSALIALMPAVLFAADRENNESIASAETHNPVWQYHVSLIKFERQFSTRDDQYYGEWAGFFLAKRSRDSLWFTTKGSAQHGETDSSEIRLMYSRTVRPFLDLHAGWRRDLKPDPERDWFGFGLLSILPYKVGADLSFFIGESGRFATRLEFAYKYSFTERLSLSPDLEANFYSDDDPQRSIGSGLSDLDLGLRLRYRVIKGVLPYTGIVWKGNFGRTADIIESRGEDASDLRVMVGVTLKY